MFVIVHKGSVILGPKAWNKRLFEQVILEDTEKTVLLDYSNSGVVVIDDETKIYPIVSSDLPSYNPRTEFLNGPYYTFHEDYAELYYLAQDLALDVAKQFLKAQVTDLRYNREVSGFQHIVHNTSISIDTSREGRKIFDETFSTMTDEEIVNWKFPEIWIAITKADLNDILLARKAHIQNSFNWERTKHEEIDDVTSLSELNEIDIS